MKVRKGIIVGLLFAFTTSLAGCMGGVGTAAVLSAIVYYEVSKTHDIAEVELKATPDAIYQAAIKTAGKNPDVSIVKQDDKDKTIEFKKGDREATLKIKEKKDGFSLLTIESKKTKSEDVSTPNLVLESVKKICDEMGIEYKVEPKKKF
ncbi:MAG TPA: hypothetical protein VIS94_14960 [Desulfomonilia bacterium]